MRKYNPINFNMCSSESDFRSLVSEAGVVLLYGELCLDYINTKNSNNNNNNDSEENEKAKETK